MCGKHRSGLTEEEQWSQTLGDKSCPKDKTVSFIKVLQGYYMMSCLSLLSFYYFSKHFPVALQASHNSSGSSLLFACSVGDHSNTDLTEKCSKLYCNEGLDDHSTPCINFLIAHIHKWMTTYTTKVTRFVNLLKMNYFYLGFWSIQSLSKMFCFFTNYNLNRCYNSEFELLEFDFKYFNDYFKKNTP